MSLLYLKLSNVSITLRIKSHYLAAAYMIWLSQPLQSYLLSLSPLHTLLQKDTQSSFQTQGFRICSFLGWNVLSLNIWIVYSFKSLLKCHFLREALASYHFLAFLSPCPKTSLLNMWSHSIYFTYIHDPCIMYLYILTHTYIHIHTHTQQNL